MAELDNPQTIEERRAALIIKYRNLQVESVEKEESRLIYILLRGDERYIMHIHLNKATIGIAYIRELRDQILEQGMDGGIIVADGKYTYSARSNSVEMAIELIPSSIPAFDVFQHKLVPLHEIMSAEEKASLSKEYHAEPYKFPWIKSDDPIAIIIGAKPGDVVRITQKSQTAGKYFSYRYVV